MFEKNMRLAYLLDFYGEILDEHSRGIMRSYYEDDLSLSEIAEGVGISRQGVRHIIKKCEEQLDFLESKLGLASQFEEIEDAVSSIDDISEQLMGEEDELHRSYAVALRAATDKIRGKG